MTGDHTDRNDRTSDTGDAACWLDQVCDACGGFIEDGSEHHCRDAVDRATGTSDSTPPQS